MAMRLTLRTMLAYMEEVLEPADAQELGKKIEESEFATNLMHRIRDVTRRLRLAAPKLDGKGIGLDPNTVAEYLDNLLPSERVADFEKVCLESDVHLAEVASCHQILALILGEPAEIDPAMRDRMYKVPLKLVAAPPAAAITAPPVSVTAPPVEGEEARLDRKRPEVPDYLREPAVRPARSRNMLAIAVVLLLLLGGGVFAAMQLGFLPNPMVQKVAQGPNSPPNQAGTNPTTQPAVVQDTPIDNGTQPTAQAAPSTTTGQQQMPATAAPDDTQIPGTVSGQSVPGQGAAGQPVVVQPGAAQPVAPGGATPPSQSPPIAQPPAAQPVVAQPAVPGNAVPPGNAVAGQPQQVVPGTIPATSVPAGVVPGIGQVAQPQPASPAMAPPGTVPPSTVVPGTVPAASVPSTAVAGQPSTVAPGAPAAAPPATQPGAVAPAAAPPQIAGQPPVVTPPAQIGTTAPPLVASRTVAPPGSTPATVAGIGRLISEHEVLLRYDSVNKLWKRLMTRASVSAGDQLLSLPSYRSNLTLGPSLSVQMLGGASIELLAPDERDVAGIDLLDGRVQILPLGRPGAVLRLKVGDRQAYVVFHDADATLALEVSRIRPDGSNPETEPAKLVLDVYATAGEVRWSDGSNPQVDTLKAPAHRVFSDAPPGPEAPEFTAQDFPNWIKKPDERTPIEKRASEAIDEALQPDRPISLGLKELSTDKRWEISSLALQCLAQIDEFDSFVTSLMDSTQRQSWNTQVEALRLAIARSPDTAKMVRDAFEHHRGPKGTELYRMLWGYSVEQLQAGAAAQLVKYLDSEDLDFRVLSFWNLNRIAGASHYYRPEFTAVKRATAVRAFKQKLDSGQLIPKPVEAKQ